MVMELVSFFGDDDGDDDEIGTISRRQDPSDSGWRSYSFGSYYYILDESYEIPVAHVVLWVPSDDSISSFATPIFLVFLDWLNFFFYGLYEKIIAVYPKQSNSCW
ncbi:hypothetical protein R6Q59_019263 [Mikania micrantha]